MCYDPSDSALSSSLQVGDPTVATAEKGEAMLDLSAEDVAETVLAIQAARPFEHTPFPDKRKQSSGDGPGLWAKI